jgi:hypothetical protein
MFSLMHHVGTLKVFADLQHLVAEAIHLAGGDSCPLGTVRVLVLLWIVLL